MPVYDLAVLSLAIVLTIVYLGIIVRIWDIAMHTIRRN